MTEVTPQLTLAGQSWPVSFFVLGEMKVISPMISAYQKDLMQQGETPASWEALCKIILFTIQRVDKDFTQEKLDALVTTQYEMVEAFLVICKQSGRRLIEGEAPGKSAPNPTGMTS